MEKIWNIYLINDSDFQLDGVMLVSKAFGTIDGEMKKTSSLRHAFVEVPPVSVKNPLSERPVIVGAGVAEGEELPADVGDGDLLAANGDLLHRTHGNLALLRDLHEIRHC